MTKLESAPDGAKIKFVLTLSIEGDTLDQVDDGLIKAAGERLVARMKSPPSLNVKNSSQSNSIRPGIMANAERYASNAAADAEREKRKEEAKERKVEAVSTVEIDDALNVDPPARRAFIAVHKRRGSSAARACLEQFGVMSTWELLDGQIEPFVQKCNSLLVEENKSGN